MFTSTIPESVVDFLFTIFTVRSIRSSLEELMAVNEGRNIIWESCARDSLTEQKKKNKAKNQPKSNGSISVPSFKG